MKFAVIFQLLQLRECTTWPYFRSLIRHFVGINWRSKLQFHSRKSQLWTSLFCPNFNSYFLNIRDYVLENISMSECYISLSVRKKNDGIEMTDNVNESFTCLLSHKWKCTSILGSNAQVLWKIWHNRMVLINILHSNHNNLSANYWQ